MRSSVKTLFLVFLLSSIVGVASASTDPLKKPNIWQLLQEQPESEALWTAYIGKPWVCMTVKEKEDVSKWKQMLFSNMPVVAAEETINSNAEFETAEFWDEEPTQEEITAKEIVQKQEELKQHFAAMEQVMMQDPPELKFLMGNINQNFILIEDTYRQEFTSIGVEYISYSMVHPKGEFPRDEWLELKAKELKAAKARHFSKMRAEMLSAYSY